MWTVFEPMVPVSTEGMVLLAVAAAVMLGVPHQPCRVLGLVVRDNPYGFCLAG